MDFSLLDRTLPNLVRAAAERRPDGLFLIHRDRQWTYGDLAVETDALARGLLRWGVGRGARVALILDNCPEYVLTLLAVARLGAINVPINTAARGDLLRYYLADADCTHLICQSDYLPVVKAAWSEMSIPVAVLPGSGQGPDETNRNAAGPQWADLLADGVSAVGAELGAPPAASDPWLILYTSGTTGPSKGSLCPHAHSLSIARTQARRMDLDPADRLYTFLPLFHGNALNYATLTALWAQATVALETRFSASRFWSDVHRYGATQFNAMMIVTSILEKLPVTPEEQSNPVRIAALVPPPVNRRQLEERWGLSIISQYALSEACPVAVLNPGDAYDKPRSSGKLADALEVRIVDEHDQEVPRGVAGEIVLRPKEPWTMLTEYYGKPEATAKAFRNLWFHTGDRAYVDDDGYLFFVDRVKDAIRRRGENISAYEIETILRGCAGVVEAAAVPVPSEMGEDEVCVFVVRADPGLTEAALVDYAVGAMAYYMVPRYVAFIEEMPKTPSEKVFKEPLRKLARETYRTMWDREAAGLKVDRFTALRREGAAG